MTTERTNLDRAPSNKLYITLTIILALLSVVGLYLYSLIPKPVSLSDDNDIVIDRSLNSDDFSTTPNTNISPVVSPRVTDIPGTKGGVGEVSEGTLLTDSFAVKYSPDRKLYEDREGTGTRYTLYSPSGNIAIHVGTRWSWLHPGRTFSTDFKVASQPTFVYQTTTQTLVDFESGGQKYTVQCVHGGRSSQIEECDQLLSDFKLL